MDVFMDAGCLQKILTRENALRRIEKRHQDRVFAFRQRDGPPVRIREGLAQPIKLPVTETKASPLPLLRGLDGCMMLPPQHSTHAGQQLAQAKLLEQVRIGTNLKP